MHRLGPRFRGPNFGTLQIDWVAPGGCPQARPTRSAASFHGGR